MVRPDPSVVFRIQSVNLLTCVELLDRSSSDEKGLMNIKLRPLKETAYQYWRLEYEENTSHCGIRNVADSNQYLGYDASTEIAYAGKAFNSARSIVVSRRDGDYRLSVTTPSETREFRASCASDDVRVVSESDQDEDERKWQLVPVAPRPQLVMDDDMGTFRIRSHDGKSLLTMPERSTGSTSVYVRSQLDQSPYQRWKATMKSSGHTTFQNEGSKLYLGCSVEPAVGVGLVGLSGEYLWTTGNFGGFAWSFTIPGQYLSMGVADYVVMDKDEVCLLPSDNTSSQVWFIEMGYSIGKDKIHAKREVQEGKYLLKSIKDNATYMNVFSNPWRIVPGSATTTKFELKYIDATSARFNLTYVVTAPEKQIVTVISDDIVEYIGLNRKGAEFVLLEKDEGDQGYVMCLPESGRPLKVASGRTTTDNNKNSVFAVDNQVVGDFMQKWILVPTT